MNRTTLLFLLLITVASASILCAFEHPPRLIGPAIVEMRLSAEFGEMERPVVEFDHGAHTEALEPDSCATCHRIDEEGVLTPRMASVLEIENRDDLVDAYHDACMSCHRERAAEKLATGPVTCGGCHVRRAPGVPARAAMRFDYSLHARHTLASKDTCENCHHIFDEAAEKLRYEKGAEEGCSACHGAVDQERKLSLANASHQACVSCHLERIRLGEESGPTLCVGCHDLEARSSIEVLEEIPRLVRGQKDTLWVSGELSKTAAVPFNHLAHEGHTTFCSDCHHQSLRPCDECHTQMGATDGDGVTTEQAYHLPSSDHSCVGCHDALINDRPACVGCHRAVATVSSDRTCVLCHAGPRPGSEALKMLPVVEEVQFDALPGLSEDYPETVVIDLLVDRYEASILPHAKIVYALATGTAESTLANSFHDGSATLCSGCHHHTPIGVRPPPCRSCHAATADATMDRPGLKVAYHRQCVGCHMDMKVDKVGCTDCHAVRTEEDAS